MNEIEKTSSHNAQGDSHKVSIAMARSGPIPSASELAAYDKIKPGFADRILSMAEEQSNHRKQLESKHLDAEIKHLDKRDNEAKLGQIFGFIIALCGIGSGLWAALYGSQVYGSIIGFSTLASIVYIFVKGRDQK